MNDELTLSGKRFVSSRRASDETGYTQDYIGQLARGGLIEAQRVGGLWYVTLDSLQMYRDADDRDESRPHADEALAVAHSVHNEFVSFDGKDYISASRAADLTGYHQDYVGQLARSGKVLSRQIGKRWYVERSGILAHKEQKDALLAAVQAQSVGLIHSENVQTATRIPEHEESHTAFTYSTEQHADLLPRIEPTPAPLQLAPELFDDADDTAEEHATYPVPIRIDKRRNPVAGQAFMRPSRPRPIKRERTTNVAMLMTSAFTVVVVLSFGLSLFESGTKFTDAIVPARPNRGTFLGAAAAAFERYGALMESILIPEVVYVKKK